MYTINAKDVSSYDVLLIVGSAFQTESKEGIVSAHNTSNAESPNLEVIPEVTDVVTDEMQNVQFVNESHVGNNRFRVMLMMQSSRYNESVKEGENEEEGVSIAKKLINTVCHECEPAGRFLRLIVGEKNYMDLGDGDRTIQIVRELLRNSDENTGILVKETPNETKDTTTQDCVIVENDTEALTKSVKTFNLADRRFSVSGVFKMAKRIRMTGKPGEPVSRGSISTAMTSKSDGTKTAEQEPIDSDISDGDMEGHKRPRRNSLLRRSLNMTRTFFRADGSKYGDNIHKRYRRISILRNTSKTPAAKNSISIIGAVPHSELNENDVLMTYIPTPSILPTENVGNNRIRVMMDMNRDKFNDRSMSIPERQLICQEIYTFAAEGKFSGKCLVKASNKSNRYAELSRENALYVLDWCLDEEKPQYHDSKSIADSTFSMPTAGPQNTHENTSQPDLISSSNDKSDSQYSNSTVQRRNSLSSSFKEYRSAALKSLRLRKQKKTVLSTLKTKNIEELQHYVKVTGPGD